MRSAIEWTDATWNPVAGCTRVSPGCDHCYAIRMAARLERMGSGKYRGLTRTKAAGPDWTGAVTLDHAALEKPRRWRRGRRVFVNSMSDLFHAAVPDAFVEAVWTAMEAAPQHAFQILTKRPERMLEMTARLPTLPHVWLGVSVESQEHAWRVQQLRRTPAAVRFVSFEPLLGPIMDLDLACIEWAIVGGESGPGARPMEHAWVAAVQRAAVEAGAAFFFKQWGARQGKGGRTWLGRTWEEMPIEPPACAFGRPRPGRRRRDAQARLDTLEA